jgi:hypothetical protein
MSQKMLAEVVLRFNTEVLEIHKFVGLVKAKFAIHIRHILDLNKALRANKFHQLPVRNYLRTEHHLTAAEISDLLPAIDRITPQIDQRMSDLQGRLDTDPPVASDRDQGFLGEWIGWFLDRMPPNPTDMDIEALRQQAEYGIERECDPATADPEIHTILDIAIRYALYNNVHGQLGALQDIRDFFEEVKTIAASGTGEAVTDITGNPSST